MDITEECAKIFVNKITGEFLSYCSLYPLAQLRKAEFTEDEEYMFKIMDNLISISLYNYRQHGHPKFVTSPSKALYAMAYKKEIVMKPLDVIVKDSTISMPEIKSAFNMTRLYIEGLQRAMLNMFEAINKYGEEQNGKR